MSTQETSSVVDSTAERFVGQVKWFNNKAGYGFITARDGVHAAKDIFVHYSTVNVTNSQYKYLVQGEYVEFAVETSTKDNHEIQAVAVSGIKGGALMCETRRTQRPDGDAPRSSAPRKYTARRDGDEGESPRRRPVRRVKEDKVEKAE